MKYIVAFFRFWRHFILGDDSTIAISVMWTLLFTWSLSDSFFNSWFIVPLAVTILLAALVYINASPRSHRIELGNSRQIWLMIVMPMVAVTAVPNFIFRFINNYIDFEHLVLPLSIYILIAVVVGLIVSGLFKFFPALCVFAAGVISYLLLMIYQPEVVRLTMSLTENYAVISNVLAFVICAGFIVRTVLVFRPNLLRKTS